MEKTFHITTFGCQMNEHDSEILAGMLEASGYTGNVERNQSDVIIINTCSVRDNADKRFFGTLGQLKKVKEENQDKVIAVCGCMMQQQHIVDTIKEKYPWVDLVFGTMNLHEFPKLLENLNNEKQKLIAIKEEADEQIVEGLPAHRKYPFKAFVTIMYGCNNFCTYCIVPYTRGRERSRKPEDILNEIRNLAKDGTKEVTLLGQNVNSYGNESDFDMDFAGLIQEINQIDGIERIRFMTSHPKDLSDRLIEAYGNCDKLCKSLHLPVQAGSTEILRRMNRKYTKEDYLNLVAKLKKVCPEIAITTDIIVGFPGETEADFEETLDLIRQVRYDSAFTFLYSVRKGTPAENYEDQVPEPVKHARFNRLVDLVNSISAEKNAALMGKTLKVLVEGASKTDPEMKSGRTESSHLVNFKAPDDTIGRIIEIKITEAKTFSLLGEVI